MVPVYFLSEALEGLGVGQALEDRALAAVGELGVVADALDALLDPALLVRILDVHELHADLAAIGLADDLVDLAQACHLAPQHLAGSAGPTSG